MKEGKNQKGLRYHIHKNCVGGLLDDFAEPVHYIIVERIQAKQFKNDQANIDVRIL